MREENALERIPRTFIGLKLRRRESVFEADMKF